MAGIASLRHVGYAYTVLQTRGNQGQEVTPTIDTDAWYKKANLLLAGQCTNGLSFAPAGKFYGKLLLPRARIIFTRVAMPGCEFEDIGTHRVRMYYDTSAKR